MTKPFLRGAIALLLLAGCGAPGGSSAAPSGTDGDTRSVPATTPDADPGSVDGRTFLSTAITQDGADFPLVADTRIHLTFRDGQATVNAGCNTIGGTYLVADGRLSWEGGTMTEMGCDAARHEQDEWVAGFLASDPQLTLDAEELVLASGGVVMTFLDREVADPDLPLTGTIWTVTSILLGDAVASVPGDAVATFEFADDGTVAVQTGCNAGGGRYELDGDRLRFVDVVTTLVGCPGPAGELEGHVQSLVTANEIRFTIEADSLTMVAGDHGLGLTGS